jgi:Carboxypeptidase regulatory-like domain
MKPVKLLPFLLLLLSGTVPAQLAQPTPNPAEKPNVFLQGEPKVDKSHLRDVKGIVRDVNGNALEGATVRLKNLKSGNVVSTQTKKDGSYIYYDLDMRLDFELAATHEGFEGPVTKKVSPYDERKPAVRNFELQPKPQAAAKK